MRARAVLVHGFTQTARSWDGVAARLPPSVDAVVVELPWAATTFAEAASALGDIGGRACYAGYSMGGRLSLMLALDRPDLVAALVLVSASPGLADAGERAHRREADERLAADVERLGVAAFVDRWLAQPLFAGTVVPPDELAARKANPPERLVHALRAWGTGTQPSLWERLTELAMPVHLVAGERDDKFHEIADRMAEAIGDNARTHVVPGAGHAVLLDQPALCAEVIAEAAGHAATR